MAIDVKEVSKFTSGLIGASSETDIGDDFATFSLDVDSEFERGALRGIKGNYILGESGWELPRYSRWRLRFTSNLPLNYAGKGFLLYGYNKIFLIYYNTTDTVPSDVTAQASLKNWTVKNVNAFGFTTKKQFADATIEAINNLEPNTALKNASNINNYFTSFYTTNSDSDAFVVIRSLFVGDLAMPQSHTDDLEFSYGVTNYNLKLKTSDTTSYVIFPDKGEYQSVTTPSAWSDTKDGKFVRGNGLTPETNSENMPYGFKFLKNINQKGKSNLFGITTSSTAQLLKNIGTDSFSVKDLGSVSSSDNKFNVTAEQRNKNLYIGTGGPVGTSSLWLGQVDRKQLDKNFDEEDVLESNQLKPLNVNSGDISVDNLIVPTLHYGLTSENGGIAGSANIYAIASSDTDKTNANITILTEMRSVNGWAKKCLANATGQIPANYSAFKEGMIFRLDMGDAFVASSFEMDMLSIDDGGANAYTHLRKLKSFAKGNLDDVNQVGIDNAITSTTGGSDNEELHSGDLFQIVYAPSTGAIDTTVAEDGTDLIRFVYIGHLGSNVDQQTHGGLVNNDPFRHDNKECYSGTPAYAFGHVNDGKFLYRFKTTSKNNSQIKNEINSTVIYDSEGNAVSNKFKMVEMIDLEDAFSVPGFEISTIAECKSADGANNFGGDTTNKNYHMGYGKLWIANKNEHNVLYLVDITNWDKLNADSNSINFIKVTLDFERLHSTLISKDDTTHGEGLVRLWSGSNGDWDYENIIGDYTWEPEPKNQYIASICETYSHQPHLGDGATAGAGTGKWRVWVNYNKLDDNPHTRWDLFLFNFRPQGWELYTGATDTQDGLGENDNQTVYMFDKTPPYQECSYIYENGKHYYPYDKFAITKNIPPDSQKKYFSTSDNGTEDNFGPEYMSIRGSDLRFDNEDESGNGDGWDACEFRNPSGEFLSWYHNRTGDSFNMFLGTNIGWTVQGNRQWSNFRHCLRPHFKQWYFTGLTNITSATELDNSVAHIVSFFGKLSGKFIKRGGTLGTWNSNDDRSWRHLDSATIESYENDIVMFSMHDSPVAFANVTGGNNEATFVTEIQGAPNTDSSDVVENAGTINAKFKDTEAGWRTDNSIPATQGYSRFNQYRYNHDHCGTKDLHDDEGNPSNRKGYVNTVADIGGGGAYYGSDGFGHYNMVTTTWASNQDVWHSIKGENNEKWRVYGFGIEKLKRLERDSSANSDEPFIDIEDNRYDLYNRNDADYDKQPETKFGTGYLTYRFPNTTSTYGDERAGYYNITDSDPITFSHSSGGTDPTGTYWDNRKAVFCWSTTALTDSVFKNTDYTEVKHSTDNRFEVMVSPRCSFRKLELPAGYKFEEINNVDFISWHEIYGNTTKIKHGYILSGKADNSPIKSAEITSTIMCVIDNKSIDNYRKNGSAVAASDGNDKLLQYSASQSEAAISPIIPLQKQVFTSQNSFYDQIVTYTNDNLIFKNLNQGLSDYPHPFGLGFRDRKSNLPDQPQNLTTIKIETYSPIIVGDNGDNNKEILHNWCRPQFQKATADLGTMGTFPYYKYDKLWNYWSTDERSPNDNTDATLENADIESGFDHAVLINDEKIKIHKRPTEGWGSTAGTTFNAGTPDAKYPSTYDSDLNTSSGIGAHSKVLNTSIIDSYHEEPADVTVIDGESQNVGVEFKENSTVYYKLSFVYDGFQESPLSDHTYEIDVSKDCKYLGLVLKVPGATELHINSRVTHINVYRKNNLKDLFRLVKSVALDQKDDIFILNNNLYEYKFNDERTTISYEGLNGVSETLKHLTPNYALSCQLNDFLFVAKVSHPKIENGEHVLLRSKQGKFSMFDWSNDFLDLPMQPKAMASFANRIFLFDENNTYIVNPEGMYIEEKTEGVGILNSQSVVVTDDGMFFADRNNIYAHNGRNAVPIGDAILYNHSRPEWQIGYLDAIKKAESLGYTPRVVYDSIKKSLYVILQGFSEVENSLSDSYENNKSRIYSFNINTKRWDYYSSPNINSAIVTNKGDVVLNDGYQLYNYRIDKRNRKAFSWESKEFVMGSSNYDKVFKRLYITGELCLLNFNNIDQTSLYEESEESEDWGLPPNPVSTEGTDFEVLNDEYQLNTSNASESDDLKVYVDGVLQTMRVQNRKPHIGHYLANDKTGSLYTIETELPTFETAINGLTDVDGNPIKNAFSLNKDSLPEFVDAPNSQYPSTTKQGELSELVHLHRGQYLYISGIIGGNEVKEIVKVKKVHLKWTQNDDGLNTIIDNNGVIVEVYRGLLGTKAQNWSGLNSEKRQIRIATPILKFPSGTKGKNCKIVFDNQKSYIDSFAITYRKTRMK